MLNRFLSRMKKYLLPIILLIIDQITKYVAATYAAPGGLFVFVKNYGIIFGFAQGINPVMVWISVLAAGVVGYLLYKTTHEQIGLGLILAGIVGNGIDRIIHGYVIDFISVGTFPVFNIADSCIVLGVVYLIGQELYQKASNSSMSSK